MVEALPVYNLAKMIPFIIFNANPHRFYNDSIDESPYSTRFLLTHESAGAIASKIVNSTSNFSGRKKRDAVSKMKKSFINGLEKTQRIAQSVGFERVGIAVDTELGKYMHILGDRFLSRGGPLIVSGYMADSNSVETEEMGKRNWEAENSFITAETLSGAYLGGVSQRVCLLALSTLSNTLLWAGAIAFGGLSLSTLAITYGSAVALQVGFKLSFVALTHFQTFRSDAYAIKILGTNEGAISLFSREKTTDHFYYPSFSERLQRIQGEHVCN